MSPAPPLMTVEEYFRTPETVQPTELVFGVLRVAESPTPRHQSVVARLFRALDTHVREGELGEVWLSPLDVVLDERRALVVQPDLFFISNDRAWIVADRVRGAPDLVIEVLSPHPRIGATHERLAWFADYGVRECWLVHQDRKEVTVLQFENPAVVEKQTIGHDQPISSRVLPRFARSLDDVLSGPL